MADTNTSKIDTAAAKAYEDAAAKPAPKNETIDIAEVVAAVEADKTPDKRPVARKSPAKKAVKTKTSTKRVAVKKAPVKKAAVAAKSTAKKTANYAAPKISALKEKIMTNTTVQNAKTTVQETAADVQARMQTAFAKTGEIASEASEVTKGNLEAVVESGKILVNGVQEMGRTAVSDAKTAFEVVTADVKKMASVKSPTELFQLQGELARRNFDAMVTQGSKNTETVVKLANDMFAPLSTRMSITAEKLGRKAA